MTNSNPLSEKTTAEIEAFITKDIRCSGVG